MKHRLVTATASLAATLLLLAGAATVASAAAQYRAGASIAFTYSDEQTVATPIARVLGDTRPGNEWIVYDVIADAGALDSWHQLYSCCVNNSTALASFRLDDLVFSSPGGTGGTATVSFNLYVRGDTQGNCNGGTLNVQGELGVGFNLGTWDAGEPPCGSGALSSGIFTGHDASTISHTFTSPTFTVPLDVPVVFQLAARAGNGSYQQVVTLDTYVSFPAPGSGLPVFNIVAGPAGVTVNSAQGNISNNAWGGGTVLAAGDEPPQQILLGPPSPNPASGRVSFTVSLPGESDVTLHVFDLRGRLVETVFAGRLPQGRHRLAWTANRTSPAGIYFLKLTAMGRDEVQRVLIVR